MITTKQAYDVVVIGSGGGLRASIGAAQAGAKTLVVSRGKINRSGATLLAGANISADIACDGESLARLGISDKNKADTREARFSDLVHEGFFLNNQKLLELFVNTAADRIGELMDWGLVVRGMEGDREISAFGSDILDALYNRAKSLGVEFAADTAFADLVTEDGVVKGAVCLDILAGELCYYPAKAVVLATGGAHDLFPSNSGSTDLCGDGPAAALRAGAQLVDMEMIFFCPFYGKRRRKSEFRFTRIYDARNGGRHVPFKRSEARHCDGGAADRPHRRTGRTCRGHSLFGLGRVFLYHRHRHPRRRSAALLVKTQKKGERHGDKSLQLQWTLKRSGWPHF